MRPKALLLVDIEESIADRLERAASSRQWVTLRLLGNVPQPIESLRIDTIVYQAPRDAEMIGDRIATLHKLAPCAHVVVLAESVHPETAFRLSQQGVTDLIQLPAPPAEIVSRCLPRERRRASTRVREVVGNSTAIQVLRSEILACAETNSSVLLTGETGTGKGLVARAIHAHSARAERRWVHVDCAALSPTLFESELFGHERGAFTGANVRRAGRFEAAAGGTLFLDEIGEIGLPLQSKFLRVLEDRCFERVGGDESHPMTARIIAATSRSLATEVHLGRFRADLFYRLRVVELRVPALRERRQDIPLLVEALLERLCEQLQLPVPHVANDFCDRLVAHRWPGNVRELSNLLEAILVRSRGQRLQARDLNGFLSGDRVASEESIPAPGTTTDESGPRTLPRGKSAEKSMLAEMLVTSGGNVALVARRCGRPRSTIRYKIQRHGLTHLVPRD